MSPTNGTVAIEELQARDDHIFNKIARGSIGQLFVSIYDDSESAANKKIIEAAETILVKRAAKRKASKLTLEFFDAASAAVWG